VSNVITIDGPVSSGKNSVGHLLSKKLGYQFIDTGSIYRIFSLFALDNLLDINNPSDLEKFHSIDVEFKSEQDHDLVFADGIDVTDKLHLPEVTELVPKVAAIKRVREISKAVQRRLGLRKDTVMAGRDIGTEIFPESKFKFYLTADLDIRAQRRFEQLVEHDPKITFEQVKKQIEDRDKMDTERKISPLRVPDGAITIDNSHRVVDETVAEMLNYVNPASK
jgi:CMP/dCMP kinase